MSDDEGQSYSAANLTRVGSASEDEYEEEEGKPKATSAAHGRETPRGAGR